MSNEQRINRNYLVMVNLTMNTRATDAHTTYR